MSDNVLIKFFSWIKGIDCLSKSKVQNRIFELEDIYDVKEHMYILKEIEKVLGEDLYSFVSVIG